EDSKANDPIQKIRSIYANGDQSTMNEATKLLINVLREGDVDSQSALRQFFDLPATSQEESDGPEIDRTLVSRVRLCINGANANRVLTLLAAYEACLPSTPRRSLLETILRDFVASRSQVEAMKCRLAEAQTLTTDAWSKCVALKNVVEEMSSR